MCSTLLQLSVSLSLTCKLTWVSQGIFLHQKWTITTFYSMLSLKENHWMNECNTYVRISQLKITIQSTMTTIGVYIRSQKVSCVNRWPFLLCLLVLFLITFNAWLLVPCMHLLWAGREYLFSSLVTGNLPHICNSTSHDKCLTSLCAGCSLRLPIRGFLSFSENTLSALVFFCNPLTAWRSSD